MRIRNRALSAAWKLLLICVATYGLLDGAGLLAGRYDPNFPHMFTNISNLFAWGYFLCAALRLLAGKKDAVFAPTAKYTATVSLLVTMLIAHFMMFDTLVQDGKLMLHLIALHYAVPLMALLDWALFDEKGKMPVWGPFAWLSLVLAYLAFTMIAVGVFGVYMGGGTTADATRYPYDFLDPALSGAGVVAQFCLMMLAAFLALGFLLFGLDRLMGRKKEKQEYMHG